jgi:hypothetical protein
MNTKISKILGIVVCFCNPRTLGGRSRRILSSRPAWVTYWYPVSELTCLLIQCTKENITSFMCNSCQKCSNLNLNKKTSEQPKLKRSFQILAYSLQNYQNHETQRKTVKNKQTNKQTNTDAPISWHGMILRMYCHVFKARSTEMCREH